MQRPTCDKEIYAAAQRLVDRGEKPTYCAIAVEAKRGVSSVYEAIKRYRARNAWPFVGGLKPTRLDPIVKREAAKMYAAGVPIKKVHQHLSKRYKISLSAVIKACGRPMKPRRTEADREAEERIVKAASDRVKERGGPLTYQTIADELGWGRSKTRNVGYRLQKKGIFIIPPHRLHKETFPRLTPSQIRERAEQIRAERGHQQERMR